MTYGDKTRGASTKADGAYLEMRDQILLGTLEPGSRIDYVQLSESLGVSITPLREALRRLEADHLVIRNAHRDVVVAALTREEASDLVAVRQELDLLAVRLAADQMTRDELSRARKLVTSQDETEALGYLREAGIPVAVGGMLSVNRAFHRMVYCGSHNQVLIQYRDAISTRTERYVILARQLSAIRPEVYRSMHEKLLAALEARDAAAAADVMGAHYRELGLDFANVIFGQAPATGKPDQSLPGQAGRHIIGHESVESNIPGAVRAGAAMAGAVRPKFARKSAKSNRRAVRDS